MALKKSELYSSLWASCDQLRGGMDATQYKDYILFFLFIKYVSDRYAGQKYAPITIPEGASFSDMVKLKGTPDIGDQINKRILEPISKENRIVFGDLNFNDGAKLGTGKEMVDRLTNLISIFQNPSLDFSRNKAEGDDLLGDAFEYLLRLFATLSGKSKGQFYTPAEVSRVVAKVLGVGGIETKASTTVYDPTCGSGSLLIKVADEAKSKLTLYGQEKDVQTSGLARMNMILHNNPEALIAQGNTLTDPKFTDGAGLKTFDYVVANPPFSDKSWTNGMNLENDPYQRFEGFGVPPNKQGDYAYLLHILRSMKPTGKGACILPHGVLFRGNAEAEIRKNLIKRGFIKAIIGLPPNLFYGTGIPACIIVLDKEQAQSRKEIFMLDASAGFTKDGPKNRLRDQDIHRIVDVCHHQASVPRYSRLVPISEIEKNDYNLNLPRYIDNQIPEDLQDIEGHLLGGIPNRDLEELNHFWTAFPTLKKKLFTPLRKGYSGLAIPLTEVKKAIFDHSEFRQFIETENHHFANLRKTMTKSLKALEKKFSPKKMIHDLSEMLLNGFQRRAMLNEYDVYQQLMDYWAEIMQDDCYGISEEGWKAVPEIPTTTGKGKQANKGWRCDLVPKDLIVARYFPTQKQELETLRANLETCTAQIGELEEEHTGEEGVFADFEKLNLATVKARLKELSATNGTLSVEEIAVLNRYLELCNLEAIQKRACNDNEKELDKLSFDKYANLTEDDVKTLVIEDKWLNTLETRFQGEMDRISQQLTQRVKELAERYANTLPQLNQQAEELEAKVKGHLERMGFK